MKTRRQSLRRDQRTSAAKKAGVARLSYAVVTSTIALAVSLLSFYFTWLHVRHSLMIGVVSASADDVTLPMNFSTDIILLNQGNRTETALSVELRFGSAGNGYTYSPKLKKGPFVLKAGDAVPVHIDWELDKDAFENVAEWKGPELEKTATGDVTLVVEAIAPTGKLINRNVVLGRFSYYDPSEELTFTSAGGEKHNLLELISGEEPLPPNKALKPTVSPSLHSGEPSA